MVVLAVVAATAALRVAWQAIAIRNESDGRSVSKVQQSGPRLIEDARESLGDEFGGGWIVHGPEREVIHIGVTNSEVRQQVADAAARLGLGGNVQVDTVRYSHAQLLGYYETLGSIATRADGVIGWGVQVDKNKVELTLSEPQEALVAKIEAALPTDAFVVTVDPGAEPIRS